MKQKIDEGVAFPAFVVVTLGRMIDHAHYLLLLLRKQSFSRLQII
jgi:hypothetical protein